MSKLHCRTFPSLPLGLDVATLTGDIGHVPPASLLDWIPHIRTHFAESDCFLMRVYADWVNPGCAGCIGLRLNTTWVYLIG